jgi:transposase
MFDTDLYQQVLGLNVSCNVTDVELEAESTEIHVHVGYTEYCCRNCLQCSGELACYDHAPERLWRHRNICHFHTLVHARVSRAECLEHGVLQVEVPWAEPHGRFTLLMERFVIDVLQACQTVKGACALVGISWDQAWPVLDRAVARRLACKQATAITPIDLDENAFRKGHRYLTFVNDVDRGTVEFVAKGQEKVSLAAFYESCTTTQFANIDNRDGHVGTLYHSTLEAVPLALSEFVFDRVPVMQHMNETVDVVRRHESRLLIAEDNDCLKRKKFLWISSNEHAHPKRWGGFRFLRGSGLKTARACAIKENLRRFWSSRVEGWARLLFFQRSSWAMRERLEPIKAVASMIDRRFDNIITDCRHELTYAVADRLNSENMRINHRAGGYRNAGNFKDVFSFYYGGL